MGKSSSNAPNVFEGSPLTGHNGYWELQWIFITFFNISSFMVHIQRFPAEIMNSDVFEEIFISLNRVFFSTWLSDRGTWDLFTFPALMSNIINKRQRSCIAGTIFVSPPTVKPDINAGNRLQFNSISFIKKGTLQRTLKYSYSYYMIMTDLLTCHQDLIMGGCY